MTSLLNKQSVRTLNGFALASLMCAVFALPVQAAVLEIEAVFEPDSSKPNKNVFVNMTPSEGFCRQVPQACEPYGLFSLGPRIAFEANAPILANHADPRQGGMTRVPSEWREVRVTHESGDSKVLSIRIGGIGHEARVPRPVTELTGGGYWDQLWEGGGWVYAPSPCQGVGWYSHGAQGYNSFWRVPIGAGVCSKKALFDIPMSFRYLYFVFAYELRTPDPLNMVAGKYKGSITYSVGPHQDFDMGDVMIPDDNQLTLNFSLDVRHTLKVDIPPGGNRVELVPQGGWQAWLTQGRKPTRLFRDQTFNLSSSSRFKMSLDCQYSTDGNRCSVRDQASGHVVPLDVSLTLPTGLVDAAGQPVSRRPLRRDGSGTELFQPRFYVDRKPGTLHFEIAQDEVEEMINPGAARSYSGTVSVIWDSEVG
ncbi:hypothetical protein BK660_20495 [Pseudomonas brassicacearum]|uniref:Fimbrial protein n=1 Tax=Pseudomonas brassicacearum TaxID=930166 RepID=A0A423HYJ5_9PSED|nr:hypothetical protein [Pseudomonas brassicacearum]RON18290.1 hypothetical protein BK660_20495 [Pseudomonas brassicacearum]